MSAPQIRRLFDLPLGSRFRYVGQKHVGAYVLLGYGDSGLVGDAPNSEGARPFQGLYSAAETRAEFERMTVEFVPVFEADQRDKLLAALRAMLDEDDGGRAADQARAVIAEVTGGTA